MSLMSLDLRYIAAPKQQEITTDVKGLSHAICLIKSQESGSHVVYYVILSKVSCILAKFSLDTPKLSFVN